LRIWSLAQRYVYGRRNTRGPVQRGVGGPVPLIGKEANDIDEVQAGRYAQLDGIITEYRNPADDYFHSEVMPLLDHPSGRELARHVGTDRRTIDRIRSGQIRTPRAELRQALAQLAERIAGGSGS
jgi:hypothetical protein